MAEVFQGNVFQNDVFQTAGVTEPSTDSNAAFGFYHPLPIPFLAGTPATVSSTDTGEGGPPGGIIDLRKFEGEFYGWFRKRKKGRHPCLDIEDKQEALKIAEAELKTAYQQESLAEKNYKREDSTQQSFLYMLERRDNVEDLEELVSCLKTQIAEEQRERDKAYRLAAIKNNIAASKTAAEIAERDNQIFKARALFQSAGSLGSLSSDMTLHRLRQQALEAQVARIKDKRDQDDEDEALSHLLLKE